MFCFFYHLKNTLKNPYVLNLDLNCFFVLFKDYRLIYMWEITFFRFLKLASSSVFFSCPLLRFFYFGLLQP